MNKDINEILQHTTNKIITKLEINMNEDMFVFCEDHTCKHNNGEVCRLHSICMKVSVGVREDCSQGAINICSNYEDRREEDAGAD